jgi:cystathionine beta-lyase family protein involved in aluminum resistance
MSPFRKPNFPGAYVIENHEAGDIGVDTVVESKIKVIGGNYTTLFPKLYMKYKESVVSQLTLRELLLQDF